MIFNIGGFDAVPYVVQDNFTVSCSPQFDTSNSFTALDGTACGERYMGDIISIRAELQEISTEKAAILSEILNQASFTVKYSDPVAKTATFKKPEVSAVCIFEGDNTEYWNYSISMTSLLVPCSDTESL